MRTTEFIIKIFSKPKIQVGICECGRKLILDSDKFIVYCDSLFCDYEKKIDDFCEKEQHQLNMLINKEKREQFEHRVK